MSGTPDCTVPEFQRAQGYLRMAAFSNIRPAPQQIVVILNTTIFFRGNISINNTWILWLSTAWFHGGFTTII